MSFAPDRVGPFGVEELQCNRPHRRDRRKLDEPFGFAVREAAGDARESVEARDQKACCSLRAGIGSHESAIFARASDVSCYGPVTRFQTFWTSLATCALPSDAAKFRAPAANTFAPDGAS